MAILPEQFEIHPTSGAPIYRQLMDQVLALLAGKQIQPGEMLPSVREMAVALGVNPMTISKAYSRLELEGIVERVRGRGMMIREQKIEGSLSKRLQDLETALQPAIVRARQLGLRDDQITPLLHKLLREIPE
ncbi:MAG TPA: GntR family transcriptional regulator [Planctomicrobium sp.]|nr:GntR family transcriptional regulator [Planctomicrobium sp.]